MNCNIPIKTVSPSQPKANIYAIESAATHQRLKLQLADEWRIDEVISWYLDSSSSDFDLLLKVHSGEYNSNDEITWAYYTGALDKASIRSGMLQSHRAFFHDGNIQFLAKQKANGDYFCLDDHGLLYFYSGNLGPIEDLVKTNLISCSNIGYVEETEHYHYRPKDADLEVKEMIGNFGMTVG